MWRQFSGVGDGSRDCKRAPKGRALKPAQPVPVPTGTKHLTGDVGRPLPASPLLRGSFSHLYLCGAQVPTCATHLTGDAGRPLPASPFFLHAWAALYASRGAGARCIWHLRYQGAGLLAACACRAGAQRSPSRCAGLLAACACRAGALQRRTGHARGGQARRSCTFQVKTKRPGAHPRSGLLS